jgi:hypothetical protein
MVRIIVECWNVFPVPNVRGAQDSKRACQSQFAFDCRANCSGSLSRDRSFAVKQKLLKRSVEKQDIGLVQKALVIACAMCEVSALLGFVERLVIGNREYYWLFLFAAGGIALHFPRRSQLESASYKQPGELG